MLEPILESLNTKTVILASSSPRRSEILRRIGLKFQTIPSVFEENLDKSSFEHPKDYVLENAKQKALEVAQRMRDDKQNNIPDLVIGSDTIVVLENEILEKPKSKENAFKMLKSLSGREHEVYSGVTLVSHSHSAVGLDKPSLTQFYERTFVTFGELTDDVINGYIKTEEPMDKAGAYGIQGIGGSLVSGIRGDYFNVMGFPLHHFCLQIKKLYE
ncbi:probable bifunctional dTTP/UTP pyrophosphatase/methyltransferase protein [Nematostella vectensis]|uniref:probable bifunctional dTTP/UTP pyrophosphatase/methyltransferase protein n=1 Tax=Nematostella vectensis TaxID=45351 RepID=UPI00207705DB|nr:probable bifunctional dTTP/UTP pyrophosphatase/methyltransferase protein [Nematostella vectensis]